MKKIKMLLIVIAMLILSSNTIAAPKVIPVFVDSQPVKFDVQPIERNERILVPFRAIAEALNVQVSWDPQAKLVYAENTLTQIKLPINKKLIYKNGEELKLDVPATIIKGRVLIPLRVFSEAFSCNVEWDTKIYGVKIYSPKVETPTEPVALAVMGYYALGNAGSSSWSDVFNKPYPQTDMGNTDVIKDLACGWYSLDTEGNLLTRSKTGWVRPDGWEDVLQAATNYNLKTEMVIHLYDPTDAEHTLQKIISNQDISKVAVENIIREATLYNGINLDLEGLNAEYRQQFLDFVTLLYQKAKENNLRLTLSLPPLNGSYTGYDYQALAKVSDDIVIMAYEYREGSTEPLYRVEKALQLAKELVPSEKLVLGINIPKENNVSFEEKVQLAAKYHLKGIALWRLGLVSDEMWNSLRNIKVAK